MLDIEQKYIEKQISGETISVLKSKKEKGTNKGKILHLHGFPGGSIDQFEELHQLLVTRGFIVYSFNYPGLWNTSGYFSLQNAFQSTIEMIDYTFNEHSDLPLFLFGESFGGFISVFATERRPEKIKKIMMRAPFPGLQLMDEEKYPKFRQSFLQSVTMLIQSRVVNVDDNQTSEIFDKWEKEYNIKTTLKNLKEFNIPIYVIMGKNDQVLPFELVKNEFANYSKFEEYDKLPHNIAEKSVWVELCTKLDIFFSRE